MRAGHVTVVGAGLSGAVVARECADAGLEVAIFEAQPHVAGHCHTERDAETGIMVHRYGPHVFHTDDEDIWNYARRFARFEACSHRVFTQVRGQVFALPVNLHTINQFFGTAMRPDDARDFISARCLQLGGTAPRNFEEQALAKVGPELYEAFFKPYTEKQWGQPATAIPASVFARLPIRFDYGQGYFDHRFQGIPRDGYTSMVRTMLDHPKITVSLEHEWAGNGAAAGGASDMTDHLFYTGPIDAFFACRHGRLGYRTLDFRNFTALGDYQGTPVMNFPDANIPWTRITEHKYFTPWEQHDRTLYTQEIPRDCGPEDPPFYPVGAEGDAARLHQYVELARGLSGVSFAGRLATYRYIDMDKCMREALALARNFLGTLGTCARPRVFAIDI